MLKVGHPKDLVLQNICHDLQCLTDHPLLKKYHYLARWVI